MAFADYEQVAEPLALPYRGKVYVLPELGIQDTIRLNLVLDPETDDDMTTAELEQLLLGDAAAQMTADNVPEAMRDKAFRTATAEFRFGREIAEQVWNLKGPAVPKAPTPTPEASAPSTSTAEASTTPSPARGSGTTASRRKPGRSATKTTAA